MLRHREGRDVQSPMVAEMTGGRQAPCRLYLKRMQLVLDNVETGPCGKATVKSVAVDRLVLSPTVTKIF